MTINFSEIIDLSHPISETMPHWPGDPETKITNFSTVAQNGYLLNSVTIGEHTGTHIGAPAHFDGSGRSIVDIPVHHLVAPAINLDIEKNVQKNRDYLLATKDIKEWEAKYNQIAHYSVILINTGWSHFWGTDKYWGADEQGLHFAGISIEATEFLIKERHIIGLGIDTAGIDGGQSPDFAANKMLAAHNIYHLENLNLQPLSASRLTITIGALPIKNGSGSPCRILGLI